MEIILIIILILYLKTYKYKYIIDDICDRFHYLTVMTNEIDDRSFYDKRKSLWTTAQCLGIFSLTCYLVYIQFGFWPAMLYAVFPVNVSGVAWKTGCYLYMTAAMLTLIAHYFCTHLGLLGLGIASVVYFTALHSGVSAIPYAFIAPFLTGNPQTLVLFVPLAMFLFGSRFRKGLRVRDEVHKNIHIEAGKFEWGRLLVMVKVYAYYILTSLWPSRLGFFPDWGWYAHHYRWDRITELCFILVPLFGWWAWSVDPIWCLAWFIFMGVFSQFVIYGMFVAERYMYLANVAFCVLVAKYLSPYPEALLILTTLYFYRSFLYIRIHRDNEALFRESMLAYPWAPENANNLANVLAERGLYSQAIIPLMYSLKATPIRCNANIHINIAKYNYRLRHYDTALKHIQEALKTCAEDVKPNLETWANDCHNHIVTLKRQVKAMRKAGVL